MVDGYVNLPSDIVDAIENTSFTNNETCQVKVDNAFEILSALSDKPIIAGISTKIDNVPTTYYGILPIVRNEGLIVIGSYALHLVMLVTAASPDTIQVTLGG